MIRDEEADTRGEKGGVIRVEEADTRGEKGGVIIHIHSGGKIGGRATSETASFLQSYPLTLRAGYIILSCLVAADSFLPHGLGSFLQSSPEG